MADHLKTITVVYGGNRGIKVFVSEYVRAADCLPKIFGLNKDFSLKIFGLIWISACLHILICHFHSAAGYPSAFLP